MNGILATIDLVLSLSCHKKTSSLHFNNSFWLLIRTADACFDCLVNVDTDY